MDKPNPEIRFIRFHLTRKGRHRGGMADAVGYFPTLEAAKAAPQNFDVDDFDVEVFDSWVGELCDVGPNEQLLLPARPKFALQKPQ